MAQNRRAQNLALSEQNREIKFLSVFTTGRLRIHKALKLALLFVVSALTVSFSAGAWAANPNLKIVDNEKVCMVTDMHFGKKQIPVEHQGKTYYGCCQNCKETLGKDATARTAVDPVTGKKVDKAKAVIAARADDSVLYFESKKSFEQYSGK